MSGGENSAVDTCCGSCGIVEIDDIKLVPCDGCDLVRYCSDDCQNNHKVEHEEACRKRAAELRDKLLFKQPESSCFGDCPICCLPMPIDEKKSITSECCSKVICFGCALANAMRLREGRLVPSCLFCREPWLSKSDEGTKKRILKRVKANDPVALCHEGMMQRSKGHNTRAFEYFTKAAKLGNAEAHKHLANMYNGGYSIEKDTRKRIYHLEEAAIGGHPACRHNLGAYEWNSGNKERAVKHYIIAATHGQDESIKVLMDEFRKGHVSKDDLASALRAHKAAVDATKSPQRDKAEECYRNSRYCRSSRC